MKHPKNYNCTQHELYAVCASGWESCKKELALFEAFKPRYTAAYVQERLDEIGLVTRMPDSYKRSAQQELLRLALTAEQKKCIRIWKMLQSHILEAWPASESAVHLKSAGLASYRDAFYKKWEACLSLIISADSFVKEQAAVLQAGNNMSAAFAAELTAQVQAYKTAYEAYLESLKTGEENTRSKLEANNKLYKDLNTMFSDARILFKDNELQKKRFSFNAVLQLVSGNNTAGIKGYLSNGNLSVADLPGLSLTLLETGKRALVNEDDAFRFTQVAAGNYTVLVEADGYVSQSIPVTVNTGSFTLLNIVMEPEARV